MATEHEARTVGLDALVGRLRTETEAHPTVYADDRRRKALLAEAADEIERLREALLGLSTMYSHAWDRVDECLVMLPDSIPKFEAAHAAAEDALLLTPKLTRAAKPRRREERSDDRC